MKFISVKEWAEQHGVSERTARNCCAQGKHDTNTVSNGIGLIKKSSDNAVEANTN